MDLALNNLQRLICPKTQTTNQPSIVWVHHKKASKMANALDYCLKVSEFEQQLHHYVHFKKVLNPLKSPAMLFFNKDNLGIRLV